MKNNKGITLIALVVTIIVLLILAGVSIAMLSGENGILSRASQASAQNELGAANDQISLFVTEKIAQFYEDSYVSGNKTTLSNGLDTYLESTCTKALLQAELGDDSNVTVNKGYDDGEIEMEISDNSNKYTSTGTISNGKVTWKITKSSL